MKLKVILSPEPKGGFFEAVPSLPGCFSQGGTEDEALVNAREAAGAWLETSNENPSPFGNGPARLGSRARDRSVKAVSGKEMCRARGRRGRRLDQVSTRLLEEGPSRRVNATASCTRRP
jgi:predicted RNase H-like HicB family nuclease